MSITTQPERLKGSALTALVGNTTSASGTRTCSVQGCDRTGRITKGLCGTHYARFLRHGDPGAATIKQYSWDGVMCAADGCLARPFANGVCLKHYKRLRRNGTFDLRSTQPIAEYMAERTRVGTAPRHRPGLGECHIWTGTLTANGYGSIGLRTHYKVPAHRMAYELAVGPISEGDVIDHLCRNRARVNPNHLEPVTDAENQRRGLGYRLRNGMDSACIHGHEYTPENTYANPNDETDIRCRTCARNLQRKRTAA